MVPAYAATIHKGQGSEYPAVVIPVLTQHYPSTAMKSHVTDITRGKRLLVLVGQKKAIAIRRAKCFGTTSLVETRPVASRRRAF
jgi:exodeoxyribonuclease V alpha subunit